MGTMKPCCSPTKPLQVPKATPPAANWQHSSNDSILALPPAYRTVLILRDLEELSTAETAEVLAITDTNVKVRLHRAHELLRTHLMARAGASGSQAFVFQAPRCNRVVDAVFQRLNLQS
jgi:RNA polymerase sigma-70 factor, ECF subfamily